MIINKDIYECPKCRKWYFFDTSKEYTAICEECKCNLTFLDNTDCDTELTEQRKNAPNMIQRKIQTVHIIYPLLNVLIVRQLILLRFQQ